MRTFQIVDSSKVVDKSGRVKVVKGRKTSESDWVVVISVNAEDGQSDVHVRVHVVDVAILFVAMRKVHGRIAHQLDHHYLKRSSLIKFGKCKKSQRNLLF